MSAKQGSIKYDFVSLWYDSNGDWTSVSRNIGEHSTHKPNGPVMLYTVYKEKRTSCATNVQSRYSDLFAPGLSES